MSTDDGTTADEAEEEENEREKDVECEVCGRRPVETPCAACLTSNGRVRHCLGCCLRRKFARGKISELTYRCAECGEPAAHKCAGCRKVAYCSKRCQIAHWNSTHRDECRGEENDDGERKNACGVDVLDSPPVCIVPGVKWGRDRAKRVVVPRFKMGNYGSVIQRLGSGSFGSVAMVKLAGGGDRFVAMKTIYLDRTPPHDVPQGILHEMEVRNLDDVGVVGTCMAAFAPGHSATRTPPRFVMSMDVAPGGTLEDIVRSGYAERASRNLKGAFSEHEMKFLAYQLVRAVAYLHGELVLSLDIKHGNVLVFGRAVTSPTVSAYLDGAITAKRLAITDFGLSRGLYAGPLYGEITGSLGYVPPEALLGCDLATHLQDVWGTACVLYEMATGDEFLDTQSDSRAGLVDAISASVGSSKAYGDVPRAEPPSALDAGYRPSSWFPLWDRSPTSFAVVDAHGSRRKKIEANLAPFPGLANLLWKMLEIDPSKRCDIFQALDDPYFDDEVVRVAREAFPEMAPGGKDQVVHLAYEPDTLRVKCASLIPVLRKKQRRKMSSTKITRRRGNPEMLVGAPYVMAAASIVGRISEMFYRYPRLRPKGMAVEARALMLFRESFYGITLKSDATDLPDQIEAVAMACCLLADKYQAGLRSTMQLSDFLSASSVKPNAIVSKERRTLEYLDFDVMRASEYDFYSAFMRGGAIDSDSANAVWETISVLMCSDEFAAEHSPHNLVVGCVAAFANADVVRPCRDDPSLDVPVDAKFKTEVAAALEMTLRASEELRDVLGAVDVDSWLDAHVGARRKVQTH